MPEIKGWLGLASRAGTSLHPQSPWKKLPAALLLCDPSRDKMEGRKILGISWVRELSQQGTAPGQ